MSGNAYLHLRLDAPLMSFGGVAVDQLGVTEPAPTQSMLTGLLGNALGYDHRDAGALQRLQQRLRYGVRRDRPGQPLRDFQTVFLGQDFLREGWTTRGAPQSRAGGSAKTGTHIRYRHYWADAVYTVVLTLEPAGEDPGLDALEVALRHPERPLFLGRKPCLPAAPLLVGRLEATDPRHALARAPLPAEDRRQPRDGGYAAWWPAGGEEPDAAPGRAIPVSDLRDWTRQVHTGRRFVRHGLIPVEEVTDAGT